MSTQSENKKARRYSPEERQKIVGFMERYNADNGRGGQKEAVKRFGVSALTLIQWARKSAGEKAGAPTDGGDGKPYVTKVRELSKLANRIERQEQEIATLKAKFSILKATL